MNQFSSSEAFYFLNTFIFSDLFYSLETRDKYNFTMEVFERVNVN